MTGRSVATASRRAQLRDFLRTRRERLTPEEVGLPAVGRRRTPGLRREEVALLAGVGVSWYTWLEQGRDINTSAEVLDAIGRALRLDDAERAHLYVLAGLNPPALHASGAVTPELRRLVDSWSPRPAILRDRYWNLLAINDGTRAAFGYDDNDRNCLIAFFTNSRYRGMHDAWAAAAPGIVAAFRADAGRAPGDPEFARLIVELASLSSEFAELWARHEVGVPVQTVKAVRHPEAGELVFDTTALVVADHPDWYLDLYNPRPGTGTAERLDELVRGPRLVVAHPG
ncbi:helix-turn-helix transcriptional regulator [Nocardia sp. CDC159]|uniref:Helix-turn-helix transcriptional regulator n=1 Tax=Nocardia pulmonis TaxID=2951408 RepID=A0A9X2ECZ6_9NOCA|nr:MULTISPECIES: helix-turn-helix transcriptional regulator [Nocardia]MCM6778574.1 helix-turn-helix transcriptional regulator [Nocardia pulmonis]MCM6791463.1 helix-turn-helix transcriptional regulator [Nocardia sp. CDC159]